MNTVLYLSLYLSVFKLGSKLSPFSPGFSRVFPPGSGVRCTWWGASCRCGASPRSWPTSGCRGPSPCWSCSRQLRGYEIEYVIHVRNMALPFSCRYLDGSVTHHTHLFHEECIHALWWQWDTVKFLISMSHNFPPNFDINVPFLSHLLNLGFILR